MRLRKLERQMGQIARDEELVVPGNGELGGDADAARLVELGAQRADDGRRRDTRRPEHGPRGDRQVFGPHRVPIDVGHPRARVHLDAEPLERATRFGR